MSFDSQFASDKKIDIESSAKDKSFRRDERDPFINFKKSIEIQSKYIGVILLSSLEHRGKDKNIKRLINSNFSQYLIISLRLQRVVCL